MRPRRIAALVITAAAAIVLAAATLAQPPEGFLVPGPAAIPLGFRLLFRSFTDAQYAQQYGSDDDQSQLNISEHTAAAGASYQQQSASLERMRHNRHGFIPKKIRDITWRGLTGAIYTTERDTAPNMFLLLDDGGRLLTIWARSGAVHRFGPDDLRAMLDGFERQGAAVAR